MSERSYWKARPAAEIIYAESVRRDERQDMRILARGFCGASALVAVFGVCLGDAELIAIAGALALLTRHIGRCAA